MELSLLTLFLTKCLDATFSTIVGNRADEVAASAWNSIRSRLRSGKVTLPANHHLEEASRESLRDAAMFLIARAWQELTPDAAWWKVWQSRRHDNQLSDAKRWLKDLERAVRADDAFATFDHAVTLERSRLHELIEGNADSLLADYFHARFLTWVDEQDLHGVRPAFFDRWIRKGWQPNQTEETLTFYQAYCLFFQDKLKHSSAAQTIFSASNQSEIIQLLGNVREVQSVFADNVAMQIGPLQEALCRTLQQLEDSQCARSELAERMAFAAESLAQIQYTLHNVERGQSELHTDLKSVRERVSQLLDRQPQAPEVEPLLRGYLVGEARRLHLMRLPLLHRPTEGQPRPLGLPAELLRIDVPLRVTYEHQGRPMENVLDDVEQWVEWTRNSFTSALLFDRGTRVTDFADKVCRVSERLQATPRFIVVGDPGCGKTTLLHSLAFRYAVRGLDSQLQQRFLVAPERRASQDELPGRDWVPVLLTCRDLLDVDVNDGLAAVIARQLQRLGAGKSDEIPVLAAELAQRVLGGRGLLLVDGLDEIPGAARRIEFTRWLASLAREHADAAIVMSSRVAGFQAIRGELVESFDHLNVAPLQPGDKEVFIKAWARLVEDATATKTSARSVEEYLLPRVCHSRRLAKLCENVFIISLVAQMHQLDGSLRSHRADIYLRFVQLMLEKQDAADGPPLNLNEVWPHLERLAYEMRLDGAQRWADVRVCEAVARSWQAVNPGQAIDAAFAAQWLDRVIGRLGILNVAGTEVDESSYVERRMIQFFHQSFQEYFAAQALRHARTGHKNAETLTQLRELVHNLEVTDRKVELFGRNERTEPVVAGQWQEVVRHCIESMGQAATDSNVSSGSADDALLMILPTTNDDTRTARALAVFAMQCLAESPLVRPETAHAIFDAAIDALSPIDGVNSDRNTYMDEAVHAVMNSEWGEMCRARLVSAFVQTDATRRSRIGAILATTFYDREQLAVENASAIVIPLLVRLRQGDLLERVHCAAELMELFYRTSSSQRDGWGVTVLGPTLQQETIETLLVVAELDDVSSEMALWALVWLVGSYGTDPDPVAFAVTDVHRQRLRQLLRDSDRERVLVSAASILSLHQEYECVFAMREWIYQWALIADGEVRRGVRPDIRVQNRIEDLEVLQTTFRRSRSAFVRGRIALQLCRMGYLSEELIDSVIEEFQDEDSGPSTVDEAVVYVTLIGGPKAQECLVRNAPVFRSADYQKLTRQESCSLWAIAATGDWPLLQRMIESGNGYDGVYVKALASLPDAAGQPLLEALLKHPVERIRFDAASTLKLLRV